METSPITTVTTSFTYKNIPRNRVDQLDSKLLDNELFELLYTNLISCFQQQNLPRWLSNLKIQKTDELKLILQLAIFKSTIWNTDSTYGMGLQNLKIVGKFKWKRQLLLGILVGNYLMKKFESFIYSMNEDGETDSGVLIQFCRKMMIRLQNIWKTLSLVNFALFLLDGKYPTLLFRFLRLTLSKLSLSSVSMNDTENISYEFQNRQLVWNTLTEFLIFIIPMLKISNYPRFWRKNKKEENSESVLINHKPINQCAICIQESRRINISVPYVTNCNHIYCYVCIMTKLEKFKESNKNQPIKEYWKCLECGSDVRWCRLFDDVDESAITVKFVETRDNDDTDTVESHLEKMEEVEEEEGGEEENTSYGYAVDSEELEDEDEDDVAGFFVAGD